MPKPSVIVWDLETVPDLRGFAAANDLIGKTDADIREASRQQVPKAHLPLDRVHRRDRRSPREPITGRWTRWVRRMSGNELRSN